MFIIGTLATQLLVLYFIGLLIIIIWDPYFASFIVSCC